MRISLVGGIDRLQRRSGNSLAAASGSGEKSTFRGDVGGSAENGILAHPHSGNDSLQPCRGLFLLRAERGSEGLSGRRLFQSIGSLVKVRERLGFGRKKAARAGCARSDNRCHDCNCKTSFHGYPSSEKPRLANGATSTVSPAPTRTRHAPSPKILRRTTSVDSEFPVAPGIKVR